MNPSTERALDRCGPEALLTEALLAIRFRRLSHLRQSSLLLQRSGSDLSTGSE